MRFASATLPLLALTATGVTAEQQQHPLGALYDKFASYIPEAYRPATSPFDAWSSSASQAADEATAKFASKNVTPLTSDNWRSTLAKSTTSKAGVGDVWWVSTLR